MSENRLTGAARVLARYQPLPALLLGLLLRLIGLESRSLQYDDTFSILLAARSLPEIVRGTAADTMPPLYYLLLHSWMLVGQSAWFIRLLSVLLSLAAIWIFYHLVKLWLGKSAAGWGAFLAAIAPLMLYHSQDVRMYALLVTLQLGYFWFFSRLWLAKSEQQFRWGSWAGLVACGAGAMYSHNVAVFALCVPNLFLLLRREWKMFFRLLAAQLIVGLLALPWLLLIPGQIAKVQKAWTLPPPGLVEVIQAIIMFTASLPLAVPLLAIAMVLSLQIFVMLALELWRGRKQPPSVLFWLLLLFVPPVLLFTASYIMRPVFVPRTFLVSSLAYAALAGLVISRTWSRGVGKLLAAAFVLAAAISLPSHYLYDQFPRSPYRQVTTYLEGQVQPGERVIHDTKLSYFPCHFYAPDLPQVFIADPPGSPNDTFEPGSQQAMQIFPQPDLPAAVGESNEIYFITFSQTFNEYQAMGLAEHPSIAWLTKHFRQVDRQVYSDLEIYHFQR